MPIDIKPGEPVRAEHIKLLFRLYEKMKNVRGGPGVEIKNLENALFIGLSPSASANDTILNLTGNASGGGIYTATVMDGPTAAVNPSTNLSQSNVTGSTGADCYAVHGGEIGSTTHVLHTGTYCGQLLPLPSTDNKPVYLLKFSIFLEESCLSAGGSGV